MKLLDCAYRDSNFRACPTDATEPPKSWIILAAFSTKAAFDGARTPCSIYILSSRPTLTCPPSKTDAATIGNWNLEIPKADHTAFLGNMLFIMIIDSTVAGAP